MSQGLRYNGGKTRHDLIPAFAQEEYAKVITFGAGKYPPRNWEKGMPWSSVIASLKRHILAFERGEDIDKESGLLHMAHAMCNAAFLLEYHRIYPQGDDRRKWYLSDKRVYLDIDGVLADFEKHFLSYLGLPDYHPKDWDDHRFRENFHKISKDVDFWMSMPKLLDISDIPFDFKGYCTSRPIEHDVTRKWLRDNGFPDKELLCVGEDCSKVELLTGKCDLFVDDHIKNFRELNNSGITTLLMSRPQNKRYDVGSLRINSLAEVVNFL